MAWRRIRSPNWSETDVRAFADAKLRLNPQTLAPFMAEEAGASNARDTASPVDWPRLLRQIRCPALLIAGDPALGAMVTASQAAMLQEQVPTLHLSRTPAMTSGAIKLAPF